MAEEIKRFTGAELKVGMTASRTKTITKMRYRVFWKSIHRYKSNAL